MNATPYGFAIERAARKLMTEAPAFSAEDFARLVPDAIGNFNAAALGAAAVLRANEIRDQLREAYTR
jgi:hypothetical protein